MAPEQTALTKWTTTATYPGPPERDKFTFDGIHETRGGIVGRIVRDTEYDIEITNSPITWLLDNVEPYLEARKIGEMEIPSSYASWDEEWPCDKEHITGQRQYTFLGTADLPEDTHRTRIDYYLWSEMVELALRLESDGGRYSPSDYTLHLGLPMSVLEGPDGQVGILASLEKNTSAATLRTFDPFVDEETWLDYADNHPMFTETDDWFQSNARTDAGRPAAGD